MNQSIFSRDGWITIERIRGTIKDGDRVEIILQGPDLVLKRIKWPSPTSESQQE